MSNEVFTSHQGALENLFFQNTEETRLHGVGMA
jgi:hypothetical protein